MIYGPAHTNLVLIAYAQKPLINDHVTMTNVSDHFNSPGHSDQDFSFMLIDKASNNLKKAFKGNYLDACFRYNFSKRNAFQSSNLTKYLLVVTIVVC